MELLHALKSQIVSLTSLSPNPIPQSVVCNTWEQVWRSLVRFLAQPIFLLRIDDGRCDIIYFFLTFVHFFYNGYVGKQPVAWKECCAKNWLKELHKSMIRRTGCHNVTEILLKTVFSTIQSIINPFIRSPKTLDLAKLKAFEDNRLHVAKMPKFVFNP